MVILELSNLIECVNYMLLLQIFIIVIVLVAANVYLYKSEKSRKEEEKEELLKTKQKMIQEGVAENEINEDDLKDEIAPKPRYAWIFGVIVCLDIWIVGAVVTHLWAGTFFTEVDPNDNRKALFGDSFGAVNALISAFAFAVFNARPTPSRAIPATAAHPPLFIRFGAAVVETNPPTIVTQGCFSA
jgi:purine-cytosine permease-like protein